MVGQMDNWPLHPPRKILAPSVIVDESLLNGYVGELNAIQNKLSSNLNVPLKNCAIQVGTHFV